MTNIKAVLNHMKETDLGQFLALEMVAEITIKREDKGLSQRALSELSGIPQKTISRIESGLDIPQFDTIGKLMQALGCVPKITFEYKDE